MKYKIKVEVMQDGSSRYYPMVKKHWWSCWKYIAFSGRISFYGDKLYVLTTEDAELRIKKYKELTIDHIYYIPYKEEEQ
ncbi:MAG: hypothetical protein Q4A15_13015 [Prevotellaceae bacterium]|nr:hypothetical protein [Prevotellaceae bacterium]